MKLVLVVLSLASTPVNRASVRHQFDYASGSCDDFNRVAQTRGVREPSGQLRKGSLGFTECKLHVEPFPRGARGVKAEQYGAKVCISADLGTMVIETIEQMTTLRWDTGNRRLSAQCSQEIQKVEDAVVAHEENHVTDCHLVRDALIAEWRSTARVFRVCGPGSAGTAPLVEQVQTQISRQVESVINRFNADLNNRSARTHERIGFGSRGLDCTRCR